MAVRTRRPQHCPSRVGKQRIHGCRYGPYNSLGYYAASQATAGPAVVQAASIQQANNTLTTSLVLAKPTDLAAGDLMVATMMGTNDITYTPPSGWTQVDPGGTSRGTSFWKIATSGDVAAANFTFNAGLTNHAGFIFRISGVNQTTPVANDSTAQTTNDPAITGSSTIDNTSQLLVALYLTPAATPTITSVPSGMTERVRNSTTFTKGIADRTNMSSGIYPGMSWDLSASGSMSLLTMLVVNPA